MRTSYSRAARGLTQAGFTLIELLIVIGILGMLMVFVLPGIIGGQYSANLFACTQNMKLMYQGVVQYRSTHGQRIPRGGGATFLYELWRTRNIPHTDKGRRAMFCPAVTVTQGEDMPALKADIETLWKTEDSFTSHSTSYAARMLKHKQSMMKERQVWFADDNEEWSNHNRGDINVFYSDGTAKTLARDWMEDEGYWQSDDEEYYIPVGPESPIKALQKVTPFPESRK